VEEFTKAAPRDYASLDHIVNRHYDDDEEISLLLKYIRSRDET
jgi:hypothetical protein